MKLRLVARCLLSAWMLQSIDGFASDGTVTFNGQIIDGGTCTITVTPGAGADVAVTLPQVAASALQSGQHAGATPFSIVLSACTYSGSKVKAEFFSPSINGATGNLVNTASTNAAVHVELQLLNSDGVTPVVVGTGGSGASGSSEVFFTGASGSGAATLSYFVRYVAVGGNASAGQVQALGTYTLTYL